MKPVKTEFTNSALTSPEDSTNVDELPITRLVLHDGCPAVESCWELSKEELKKVKETGKIYFACMGITHPPILLSVKSLLES